MSKSCDVSDYFKPVAASDISEHIFDNIRTRVLDVKDEFLPDDVVSAKRNLFFYQTDSENGLFAVLHIHLVFMILACAASTVLSINYGSIPSLSPLFGHNNAYVVFNIFLYGLFLHIWTVVYNKIAFKLRKRELAELLGTFPISRLLSYIPDESDPDNRQLFLASEELFSSLVLEHIDPKWLDRLEAYDILLEYIVVTVDISKRNELE